MNSICIFGVFVADLCFFAEKIPVKGETVLGKNHIIGPGGKGSNQAIAAARLGGNVNFITKIGKDQKARNIKRKTKFKIKKDFKVVT